MLPSLSHLKWLPSISLCSVTAIFPQVCSVTLFPTSLTTPLSGPSHGWPYSQLLGPGLAAQPTESFLRASPLHSWLPHQDQRSDLEAFAESNTVTQGCQLQVESWGHPASCDEYWPKSHETSWV